MRALALDLRALRALPFAMVCVVVSGLGHSLGGGGTVTLPALLVGGLVVWAVATALAGRERSLGSIAAGLAVGQLGLHLFFHETSGAMAGMPGMDMTAGAASSGGNALTELAMRLICGPDASGSAAGALPPGTTAGQIVSRAGLDPHLVVTALPHLDFWTHSAVLGLTPLMLLGHLGAALAIGWWLRCGEAALWRAARAVGSHAETTARTWAAPLRTVLALAAALLHGLVGLEPARAGTAADRAPWRLPRRTLLRHQVVRRGPPVAPAA